jgi:hypothetical protein
MGSTRKFSRPNSLQPHLKTTIIPNPIRLLRRYPIFVRERQLELEIVQELGHQDSHLHVRDSRKANVS